MRCRLCPNEALDLSDEVKFCWRCGRGWSVHGYDASVYDSAYSEEFGRRGGSELGRRINLARLGMLATFVPLGASVLDFGCGAGDFLGKARQGWDACGVEAHAAAAALARGRSGCRVEASLDAYAGTRLHAACFFDSLEHVEDPEALIDRVRGLLEPQGLLLVTMPELPLCFSANTSPDYLGRVFGAWRHAKPREHLSYWTFDGFRRFLEGRGFSVAHTAHTESFLRVDPMNPQRNIMTFVAVAK